MRFFYETIITLSAQVTRDFELFILHLLRVGGCGIE